MSNDNKLIAQLTAKAKRLEMELQQAKQAAKSQGGARKDWLMLDNSMQSKEEEETWFSTYLDMMTLLLVLMIVMLAFSGKGDFISGFDRAGSAAITGGAGEGEHPGAKLERDGYGAQPGDAVYGDETQGQVGDQSGEGRLMGAEGEALDADGRLNAMGFDELGDDIDVVMNEESVSFRINSEILFPSGQADLGLAGISVLKKLITVLQKNDYPIAVEGHTDSVPIRGGRYPSNWELSGSRAGSVVRYFEANGIASHRLRAVGFADTRPLQSNQTAEGRAQNRRVELTMDIPKRTGP